jgi:hypothetical protein
VSIKWRRHPHIISHEHFQSKEWHAIGKSCMILPLKFLTGVRAKGKYKYVEAPVHSRLMGKDYYTFEAA